MSPPPINVYHQAMRLAMSLEETLLLAHFEFLSNQTITSYTMDDGEEVRRSHGATLRIAP